MISPDKFLTRSLSGVSVGSKVCRILAAAINAVDPYIIVKKRLSVSDNTLEIDQYRFNLDAYKRIFLIGAGKAGVPMAAAVCDIFGERIYKGIIITKEGYGDYNRHWNCPPGLHVQEAGHPLPDKRSISGTRQIINLLSITQQEDLIFFLVSGGGSALLTSPASGITLNDLQLTTSSLLACGASIQEINCIRKHLDDIKGGHLARLATPSSVISLILSDVVGDRLDIIASGPTVPDTTSYSDALSVLNKYGLLDTVPSSVVFHLEAGAANHNLDTPRAGDSIFEHVYNILIGSNRQASLAAVAQAHREGFHTMMLTNYIRGEANQVGKIIASIARQAVLHNEPISKPACIIMGGETTVTITGNGRGGRNQEIALSTVDMIAGLENVIIVTLATDGGDGPTDAAGAVATGDTHARTKALGMSSLSFLNNNDSYNYFAAISDLIQTGPTQTNVNDLCMIFTY